MSMTRSQFKRRLKRARRASQRLANGRSQPSSPRPDGAARWIATMAAAQRAGSNDQAGAARPDRTTQRPSLIGRI